MSTYAHMNTHLYMCTCTYMNVHLSTHLAYTDKQTHPQRETHTHQFLAHRSHKKAI